MPPKASFLFSLVPVMVLSALACPKASGAEPPTQPRWPQRFEAFRGEPAGFGFVVTQPGPISVSVAVQSSPAPVLVSLSGPLAKPVQQQGTGTVQLAYLATAADVQRGQLWLVHIDSLNAPIPVQGTISVSHPPRQGPALQTRGLPANVSATGPVTVMPITQSAQLSAPTIFISSISPSQGQPGDWITVTGTDTAKADSEYYACVQYSYFHWPPPPPCPEWTVHFVINPGMEVVAQKWSQPLIVAVPNASGIQQYAGQLYVALDYHDGSAVLTTPPVPFTFVPSTVSQTIYVYSSIADSNLAAPLDPSNRTAISHADTVLGLFNSHSGDDQLYLTTNLKNGWVVDSASVQIPPLNSTALASASVTANRPGTPSLYTKVHWWEDTSAAAIYVLAINIKGPKGTSPF